MLRWDQTRVSGCPRYWFVMEILVAGVILGLCESGFMRQTLCCEVVHCTLDLLAVCCRTQRWEKPIHWGSCFLKGKFHLTSYRSSSHAVACFQPFRGPPEIAKRSGFWQRLLTLGLFESSAPSNLLQRTIGPTVRLASLANHTLFRYAMYFGRIVWRNAIAYLLCAEVL